jgi:hypothetical protein
MKKLLIFFAAVLITLGTVAQTGIVQTPSDPLIRLTPIPPPFALWGTVYLGTDSVIYYYNGTAWVGLLVGSIAHGDTTGEMLYWNNATSTLDYEHAAHMRWNPTTSRLIFGNNAGITIGESSLTRYTAGALTLSRGLYAYGYLATPDYVSAAGRFLLDSAGFYVADKTELIWRLLMERDTTGHSDVVYNLNYIGKITAEELFLTELQYGTGVDTVLGISGDSVYLISKWDIADTTYLATKYDVDTLTASVYDSLAVHLDTLQSHNTRINSIKYGLDTLTGSVYDSLAVHLDTLQSHNTRIISAYDSLADHLDSLQSHNTRINTVVNAVGDTSTIARTNQENRFIRPQGIYGGGTSDTLLSIINDKDATKDSCIIIFSKGHYLQGTNAYAGWPFDLKQPNYGIRVTAGSTSSDYPLLIRNSLNEPFFAIKGDKKVGIRQTMPTAILEVRGEKTTDALLLVSNDANATLDSTAYVNKLGEFYAMNIDTINTPTFTTDIASGVGSRVLVIPAGYWVEAIKIIDVGTTAGLTNIQAQQETSTINLITGKTCATGATMLFKTLADHNVYATAKNLTFTATGNSASGMSIVVYLRK